MNAKIEDLLKIAVFDPEFVRVRESAPAFMITLTPFDLRVVERNLTQGTGFRRMRSGDKSAHKAQLRHVIDQHARRLAHDECNHFGRACSVAHNVVRHIRETDTGKPESNSSKSATIILAAVVVSRQLAG